MKKIFPLEAPGTAPARVVEGVKTDVRKYLKRERRKAPPEGFNRWEFDCRVGPDAVAAEVKSVEAVIAAIDTVAAAGAPAVYVEILARPTKWERPPRPETVPSPPAASAPPNDSVPVAPADAKPAPPNVNTRPA